jgi:hypothetical protein
MVDWIHCFGPVVNQSMAAGQSRTAHLMHLTHMRSSILSSPVRTTVSGTVLNLRIGQWKQTLPRLHGA